MHQMRASQTEVAKSPLCSRQTPVCLTCEEKTTIGSGEMLCSFKVYPEKEVADLKEVQGS
jgi:hypothetical protein